MSLRCPTRVCSCEVSHLWTLLPLQLFQRGERSGQQLQDDGSIDIWYNTCMTFPLAHSTQTCNRKQDPGRLYTCSSGVGLKAPMKF